MKLSKQIITAIVLLIILIPIGFYSKLYSGIGHEFVNNKLGGVFYEIFWCLAFFIILPKVKAHKIAAWVLIITSILEFVQLLNNDLLAIIRSTFIGQTIIGNSFSWADFPYYIFGSGVGWLIIRLISK